MAGFGVTTEAIYQGRFRMRTYINSGKMAASKVKKSEKSCLRKIYINCITVLLAGLFVGLATAQQAPTAKAPAAQNTPAAQAPTAPEAPAAKPHDEQNS